MFVHCFTGKKVLVTGAGKGLGRALAQELYKEGATVYAVARAREDLITLVVECPSVVPVCVDLSDWDLTRNTLERVLGDETVDLLINNAAVAFNELFLEVSRECLEKQIDTNFKAVVNVSQICARKMVAGGTGGCIINISSVASTNAQPTFSIYGALKAGMDSLTRGMARELGPHKIRAVSMILGIMDTPMLARGLPPERRESYRAAIADKLLLGEMMVPIEEAVAGILFVASGKVNMMTGCTVVLDGGFTSS